MAVSLPSLPLTRKPSPGVACTARPLPARPALLTILGDAQAACELACLLLEHTKLGLAQGCQLESAEVYRLASCAGVALGPASEIAHQAYASVTEAASPQPQSPAEVAHALAECYAPLLSAAGRAVFLVLQLGSKDPVAAALKATVCRPDRIVALCHQCAPVLQWCASELGEPSGSGNTATAWLIAQLCKELRQLSSCCTCLTSPCTLGAPVLAPLCCHGVHLRTNETVLPSVVRAGYRLLCLVAEDTGRPTHLTDQRAFGCVLRT